MVSDGDADCGQGTPYYTVERIYILPNDEGSMENLMVGDVGLRDWIKAGSACSGVSAVDEMLDERIWEIILDKDYVALFLRKC